MDPTPQPMKAGPESGEPASPRPPVSLDRRALLRAGAGASPVLLTLMSRPVVAGTTCTVASSFVSVATWRSHNPTAASPQCTTRKCEDWIADSSLPATGTPSRPPYLNNPVNWLLGATMSSYNGSALWQLLVNGGLGLSSSGELGVAQHLACLALNAQYGFMPYAGGVSAAYVASVWQNYKANANRYVLSGSGINWDSTQLIDWARMLMYPSAV